MMLYTSDGGSTPMFRAPTGFTYKEVPAFGKIEREGRKTITRVTAPGLKGVSFTQTVAHEDPTKSIEDIMGRFLHCAAAGLRVRFTGCAGLESGIWWNIIDMSADITQRTPQNKPSRATLSWSLEEAVDVVKPMIRPTPPKPAPAARPVASAARTYRVVGGDSLYSIAARRLGNGARWPEIFNLNRTLLRGNPNRIYVGQTLRLP
jgi:nucleoid-associated protein YgaU